MDNLSGLDCLLSSNSSTHSLMCSFPSIDADTSILIIAHTRSTLFVLLFCLILSQPLVSLYISYLLTPHPPLIIPSCFTVLLLSLSPSLSPISLYKHLSPSQMILMLCSFASIHLFPMVHYIDIVPYFHPRCFPCPLFGNASTTRPPALAEFNCDSSGASRVLSTQQEEADLLLFPGVLPFLPLRLAWSRRAIYNLQQNNRMILFSSPTHTYHNPVPL